MIKILRNDGNCLNIDNTNQPVSIIETKKNDIIISSKVGKIIINGEEKMLLHNLLYDNIFKQNIQKKRSIDTDIETLAKSFDILTSSQNNFNQQDYINIWGDDLGVHIWRQEGSDLLRIWRNGLTTDQKLRLVEYIIKKSKKD